MKALSEKTIQEIRGRISLNSATSEDIDNLFGHIQAVEKKAMEFEEENEKLENEIDSLEREVLDLEDEEQKLCAHFLQTLEIRLGSKEQITLTRDEFNHLISDGGVFNVFTKNTLIKLRHHNDRYNYIPRNVA